MSKKFVYFIILLVFGLVIISTTSTGTDEALRSIGTGIVVGAILMTTQFENKKDYTYLKMVALAGLIFVLGILIYAKCFLT